MYNQIIMFFRYIDDEYMPLCKIKGNKTIPVQTSLSLGTISTTAHCIEQFHSFANGK